MKKPHAVVPKVKPANMSDADWAKELAARHRHRGSAAPTRDPAPAGRGGRQGRVFRKLRREPGNELR
jgi:hypothetical protein